MRRLLETLARALVDDPERVRVQEREEGGEVHLALSVAPPDRGRIIGRHGRTADSLRTVLNAAAAARSRGSRCRLEVEG